MTKKKFIYCIIIAFLVFTFSTILICNVTSTPKISQTQKEFDEFTDTIFLSDVSGSAFNLHFYLKYPAVYGIEDAPAIAGSLNYEDMKNSESYYLNYINKLKSFDYNELSDEGKRTYDIFMYYLSTELAFPDLCINYELLSPTVGMQAQLPVLLSQYTFHDEYDVVTYIKILNSIPQYFQEILAFEKVKAENGTFMGKQTLTDVVAQCSNFVSSKDNFLLETFHDRIKDLPQLNDSQKQEYIRQNEAAVNNALLPAYRMLMEGLSALKDSCKNNMGLCYNEDGKNYYNYLVHANTGSSRTVTEIETLIQTRLKKDLSILAALSKDTDVYQAILESEKIKTSDTPENILNTLIEKIKDDFPAPTSTKYTVNYVPKALEQHLSPAFYLSPPIDDPDNNQIFINNYEAFANDNLFVTLAHEGYPGHLYQTTYFSSKNPPLLRHLLDFGGYTEGWATYVEFYSYAYQYDDPKIVKALQSTASYSLALYCLADIGINYHGWSLEETCQFFASHGIEDKSVSEDIFNRMVAEPANYLQYYVGYLEFLELKKQMQELRGDNFSILEFHTYILDMGPAPFEILSKYME